MKLVFDGTYDEFVDKIVKAYHKHGSWPLADTKKRPIVRFMHRRRGGKDRCVDTVTLNGKTFITPHKISAYDSKREYYKEMCKSLIYYLIVFFTVATVFFGVWEFLFDGRLWYIPAFASVAFTCGVYGYVKVKDDAAWRKLFVFLVMEIGCLPVNEGKDSFGFKHIPSDEEKAEKKQRKQNKKNNKKIRR